MWVTVSLKAKSISNIWPFVLCILGICQKP